MNRSVRPACHGHFGRFRDPADLADNKKLFSTGKKFFIEDWFVYLPDGTYENHELCDSSACPFHKVAVPAVSRVTRLEKALLVLASV